MEVVHPMDLPHPHTSWWPVFSAVQTVTTRSVSIDVIRTLEQRGPVNVNLELFTVSPPSELEIVAK